MSSRLSEAVRKTGLRLLALAIAIGLWANASLEERQVATEKLIEASVSYDRPRGLIVLDPVRSVLVRLRGSRKAIRRLNPELVDVQIQVPQAEPGTATVQLGADDVLMPDDLEFVSIEPSAIQVEVDREITQSVEVRAKLVGEPAAGAKLGAPEVFPPQVLVSGPERRLRKLERLRTESIALEGRSETFEETVKVQSSDPLIQIVQPSKVSVRVEITPPKAAPSTPPKERKR